MKSPNELPIQYVSGMNVINIKNPKEVVGYGDYVFIARIDEEIKNVHSSVEGLDPGIPMTTSRPEATATRSRAHGSPGWVSRTT